MSVKIGINGFGRIGRLVGEALPGGELPEGRIAQIGVGPVRVDPHGSDRAVAEQIARSIRAAIGKGGQS